MAFEQGNFWTARLFGGVCLFRADHRRRCDGVGRGGENLAISCTLYAQDRTGIAQFLRTMTSSDVIEARGIDSGAILRQRMDFVLRMWRLRPDLITRRGAGPAWRSGITMRCRRNGTVWPGCCWAQDGGHGRVSATTILPYFYTLRAKRHADADLVNMLLADLTRLTMPTVHLP
jgi:hypothetical protein